VAESTRLTAQGSDNITQEEGLKVARDANGLTRLKAPWGWQGVRGDRLIGYGEQLPSISRR
jgi:hypothetical protein